MSLSIKEISNQVFLLINAQANQGLMLPKNPTEIEYRILIDWGFCEMDGDIVTAFAALYEWKKYLEIGSVITHPDYCGRGLGRLVSERALVAAKSLENKPIIALANEQSTHLFESLGFVHREHPSDEVFWEPCKQACVEYGRWPACNCHFMILDDDVRGGESK